MALTYHIPDLIAAAGNRINHPLVNAALNRALSARTEMGYQTAMREAAAEITGYDNLQDQVTDSEGRIYTPDSYFEGALPIWSPVLFQRAGDIQEDLLLDSAIINIGRSKNIVRTQVPGRSGTVKEYISDGDFEVQITGLLAQRTFGYPKDLISLFRQYMELQQALVVISTPLNSLRIYELVVTGWQLPHTPHLNCARYEISAISDEPFEFELDIKATP